MDNTSDTGTGRQRTFISYAADAMAKRKAVFESQVLGLLSKSAEDYVATLDADRLMAALAGHAASPADGDTASGAAAAEAAPDRDASPSAHDLMSRLHASRKSVVSARASTRSTDIVQGTHNADALAAGRELVEIAARRPTLGVWQVLSGKGGMGKTEILLNIAVAAYERGDMNVAVIDLGNSGTVAATMGAPFADPAEADLVLVDNAHCAPAASHRNDWWEELERQLRKSACVLVAVTPGARAAAHDPWHRRPEAWRKTEIGSFDCKFRRSLIGDMSRRQQAERGGASMTDAATTRLAEELWGNGWQIGEGVEACRSYANVMAREPRPEEIDEIAVNVGASMRREKSSSETIAATMNQLYEQAAHLVPHELDAGMEEGKRGLAIYLTKAITGRKLADVAADFGIDREGALCAVWSAENQIAINNELRKMTTDTFEATNDLNLPGNKCERSAAAPKPIPVGHGSR